MASSINGTRLIEQCKPLSVPVMPQAVECSHCTKPDFGPVGVSLHTCRSVVVALEAYLVGELVGDRPKPGDSPDPLPGSPPQVKLCLGDAVKTPVELVALPSSKAAAESGLRKSSMSSSSSSLWQKLKSMLLLLASPVE
jgi:hypothetical protein